MSTSSTKLAFSKTLSHIQAYPLVKQVLDYVLSFSVVAFLYQQFAAIAALVHLKIVDVPFVAKNLAAVDTAVDTYVLTTFDKKVLPYVPKDAADLHPVAITHKLVDTINSQVLHPINSYVYSAYDQFLPATLTENKAAFKFEELKNTADGSAAREVTTFVKIVNEFLLRARYLAADKLTEVSNTLANTYNKNFDKLSAEKNYYYKSGVASAATVKELVSTVKADYIQPLQKQTQDYVVDARSRADELISGAKQNLSETIQPKAAAAEKKAKDFVNGSTIPVSASA